MDALSKLRAEIARKKRDEPPEQQRWKRKADIEAERKQKYLAEEEQYEQLQRQKRQKLQEERDALSKAFPPGPAKRLKAWAQKPADSASVRPLKADELGSMMAAFLVSYDADLVESFEKIDKCLCAVFAKNLVCGAVVADCSLDDQAELYELIMSALSSTDGIGALFGLKVRVRTFLKQCSTASAVVQPNPREPKTGDTARASAGDSEREPSATDVPNAEDEQSEPVPVVEEKPASVKDGPPREDTLCKEDYVDACVRHYMSLWQQEVEKMPEAERKSREGRATVSHCAQTTDWLKPLRRLLQKRILKKDVLDALRNIFSAVGSGDYARANQVYLEELAIGNAPWPMGATMVGIHARAAREKISEDKIAHVMNDEQTRKYVQSVKRLISVAERHYGGNKLSQ